VDVVRTCQDLLRIDTSNPGSTEAAAAAYIAERLEDAGLEPLVLEPEPGRCSVIARQPGREPELAPAVMHGHLDVVPAGGAEDWTHDPFGGVVADGYLWGRGAVDMKNTVAAMLTLQVTWARSGQWPRRPLVFAYFADEEMGGPLGSRWIVDHRPDLFAGAAFAVGEIGGFPVRVPGGPTLYPLQAAERGMVWLRLTAVGASGHVAFTSGTGPVVHLAEALARIAQLRLPHAAPAAHRALLDALAGVPLDALGSFGAAARNAATTTFVPTVVSAGSKINVIPDTATAYVDCRVAPGQAEAAEAAVAAVLGEHVQMEVLGTSDGVATPVDAAVLDAAQRAVRTVDADGVVAPFAMPAGSDAQRLARLGIPVYGFTPLTAPASFDYLAGFHQRDERVPVEGLRDGLRMLQAFLEAC
jgi:acetylornithine deacetylase/succinyl-diaminopimelate desuccinylase-like protein